MIKPIFVFSLPRSGSTLLQKLLGSSPDVSTISEPWLLLPLFYASKSQGVFSEYSHKNSCSALNDFISNFPNKEKDYLELLREFVLQLYSKNSSSSAVYFLDKTPRYHLVIDEIIETFPDAKFIFLWRNPLSIVSSIMQTWANGRWNIYAFKIDLYRGMDNLVKAYAKHKDISYAIRYEDLVTNPELAIKEISSYLGLPVDTFETLDFQKVKLKGVMGDPTGSVRYKEVSSEALNKWSELLNNPIRKVWSHYYIKWIGSDRLALQGYDMEKILLDISLMPISFKYILNDIYCVFYGFLYCLFDFRLLKYKLKSLKEWKSVYFHN